MRAYIFSFKKDILGLLSWHMLAHLVQYSLFDKALLISYICTHFDMDSFVMHLVALLRKVFISISCFQTKNIRLPANRNNGLAQQQSFKSNLQSLPPSLHWGTFQSQSLLSLGLCVVNNRPSVSGTVFQKAMALGDRLEAGSLSYYSTLLIVWKIV